MAKVYIPGETKAQRKLFFNLRSFKGTDNNSFSDKEITSLSDKLNVKKSDVISMEMRLSNNDSSLSSPFDDSDEKQIDILDNMSLIPLSRKNVFFKDFVTRAYFIALMNID